MPETLKSEEQNKAVLLEQNEAGEAVVREGRGAERGWGR